MEEKESKTTEAQVFDLNNQSERDAATKMFFGDTFDKDE